MTALALPLLVAGDELPWGDLDDKRDRGKLYTATLGAVALVVGDSDPVVILRLDLPAGATALARVEVETLDTLAQELRAKLEVIAELRAARPGRPRREG